MAGKVILAKYPIPKIESQIVKILKQNFSAATELDLKQKKLKGKETLSYKFIYFMPQPMTADIC